jgi:hypothetical protein
MRTIHGNKTNAVREAMESHYVADNCAEYLSKFYILPHTYKHSIAIRFSAVLGTVALNVLMMSLVLHPIYSHGHHPVPGAQVDLIKVLMCAIDICVSLYFFSFTWRKTVITRHSIEIILSLSKTNIPADDVLGYAVDTVRQTNSPLGVRVSIVHNAHGRQEIKTPVTFGPGNWNDPKLRGLFMSMSNYGDVPLSEVLDDATDGKYSRLEKYLLVGLVLVTIWLWQFIPFILAG